MIDRVLCTTNTNIVKSADGEVGDLNTVEVRATIQFIASNHDIKANVTKVLSAGEEEVSIDFAETPLVLGI